MGCEICEICVCTVLKLLKCQKYTSGKVDQVSLLTTTIIIIIIIIITIIIIIVNIIIITYYCCFSDWRLFAFFVDVFSVVLESKNYAANPRLRGGLSIS